MPPPPALAVKCWAAGLHQQLLIRLNAESALREGKIDIKGQWMEERWPLAYMIADLNKEKHNQHLNQIKQQL